MKFSSQLRYIIRLQPASAYAVGKAAGIDKSTMSRFMRGGNLTMERLDSLAEVLDLHVIARNRIKPLHRGRPTKSV